MPRGATTYQGFQDVRHSSVGRLAAAVGRSRQTVHEWFLVGCPSTRPFSEVTVRLWAKAAGIDGLREPAPAVAALLGTTSAPARAEAPDRKLGDRPRPLEAVQQLVDALVSAAVEQFGEFADQAADELFPVAAEDAPLQRLSSSAVRDRIDLLVLALRERLGTNLRIALRMHLDARAPDVPPGAGTGGK